MCGCQAFKAIKKPSKTILNNLNSEEYGFHNG